MPTLTPSEDKALTELAQKLGANKETLFNLINFESKWQPDIKNPYSSARGLIQFMDSTARGMGYSSSADLVAQNPTRIAQLKNPVYQYLKKYAPFPTEQSLYMAVFYPKYRKVHPMTEFPERVQKVNPNIVTVQDYVDKVNSRAGALVVKGGLGLGGIIAITLAFIYRKKWLKYLKR